LIPSKVRETVKFVEGGLVVLFFLVFMHLATSGTAGLTGLLVAGLLVVVAVAWSWKGFVGGGRVGLVWMILGLLASGFWVFSVFRYLGLVQWPLGRPEDLTGYAVLLYSHFVLSASVLAPVMLVSVRREAVGVLGWGRWRLMPPGPWGRVALWAGAAGVWLWAGWMVWFSPVRVEGSLWAIVVICLAKAMLTGVTEEVCYRGVIQPAAIAWFGGALGIVVQSCLYAGFHIHLGEVFFPRWVFLPAVMGLGLLFGLISYVTGGVGWAIIIHTAIDVVVEWQNIS